MRKLAPPARTEEDMLDIRSVLGGLLVQDRDAGAAGELENLEEQSRHPSALPPPTK